MFYTYLWLRQDGTPYYVGKGTGNRAFWRHGRKGAKPPNDASRVLIQEFVSEQDALFAETFLISYYGRKDLGMGYLRNLTDGGDGSSGYKHTELALRKMSDNARLRVSQFNPWNGKKHSLDARIRQCNSHRTLSETQVSEIRRLRQGGVRVCDLALRFKVHQSHISKICSGDRYKF